MQNILIVGAGTGGLRILDLLQNLDFMHVQAVIDPDETAPGVLRAKHLGIPYGSDWKSYMTPNVQIIFDVSGDEAVFDALLAARPANTVLIPGSIANLLVRLVEENDTNSKRIQREVHKQRMIFDSVEEGMIGINEEGKVDFFNKRAAEMTGVSIEKAIGREIATVIPTTRLPHVFETGIAELNQELVLANGLEIVTSRLPLFDGNGRKVGAFAVFKDMTEVLARAEEITDLKKVQKMLEAIIHSSDDAISVVDERGYGLLVNPAYTRITGLTEEEVIGKPATADIREGESIHMKVLKTKKPMRGVKMFVGENENEVIVNVAPILVDQEVKGSVGVIHDITEMRNLMNELDRARMTIRKLESTYTFADIYGESSNIKLSIEQAKLATENAFPVLLRGEVGTGKELFANAIHSEGDRKCNKFIRVNCSAIHPLTLEAELFGQADEANNVKAGLFVEAEGGTLFLDEIADAPLSVQEKLLQYLKTGMIYPLGSREPMALSVRLITGTSQNLEQAVHNRMFIEELYYDLNRISIQIPPLRMRKEDLPFIISNLLVKLNEEFGMNVGEITKEAQDLLKQYDWPGNIRELENVLNRAMIYMQQSEMVLGVDELKKSLYSANRPQPSPTLSEQNTLASMMDTHERSILEKALLENEGNKSLTANRLGISLRSLYYKLEKFNLI